MTSLVGAPADVNPAENSLELEEYAKFAVDEHNKKEKANLTFKKLVGAKTQVVSGTLYHLKIEADGPEGTGVYDAKVHTQPWLHNKELKSFTKAETGGKCEPGA